MDLDGTLWDSAPWYAGLLAPGSAAERDTLANRLRNAAGGPSAAVLLRQRYTPARFAQAAHDAAHRLHLYESARDTLKQLADEFVLGVVTSLPRWMAGPMLDSLDLIDHFSVIQTAAWRVPAKPHPATLNLALATLGVPSRHAAYIGDTDADAKAAARAGVTFIGAGWGYGQLEGTEVLDGWTTVRDAL